MPSHDPHLQIALLTFFHLRPRTSKSRKTNKQTTKGKIPINSPTNTTNPKNLTYRKALTGITFPFSVTLVLKVWSQTCSLSKTWGTKTKSRSPSQTY